MSASEEEGQWTNATVGVAPAGRSVGGIAVVMATDRKWTYGRDTCTIGCATCTSQTCRRLNSERSDFDHTADLQILHVCNKRYGTFSYIYLRHAAGARSKFGPCWFAQNGALAPLPSVHFAQSFHQIKYSPFLSIERTFSDHKRNRNRFQLLN